VHCLQSLCNFSGQVELNRTTCRFSLVCTSTSSEALLRCLFDFPFSRLAAQPAAPAVSSPLALTLLVLKCVLVLGDSSSNSLHKRERSIHGQLILLLALLCMFRVRGCFPLIDVLGFQYYLVERRHRSSSLLGHCDCRCWLRREVVVIIAYIHETC
jgi:hypothetical protein